jgi:hypothetical protein
MKRDRPPPLSIEAAYDVLGLRAGAEHGAVQAAYRRLAFKHHPDIAGDDPVAREEFVRITRAYRLIATLDRLRMRKGRREAGCCARCESIDMLYVGLDRRRYCAKCLLESRRRFLPLPTYRTVRCVAVIGLQGLGVAGTISFLSNREPYIGVASFFAVLLSLVVLGIHVWSADVIEG